MKLLRLYLYVTLFWSSQSLWIYSYDYLEDYMRLDQVLLINAHNTMQSKAYGWRYYQQLGTVEEQWKAGARGGKINLHWRRPVSTAKQVQEALEQSKVGQITKKVSDFFSNIIKKKEKTIEPFIGLCHESDGKSNCILSALFQKKGEIDTALTYFKKMAKLLEQNPKDIVIILIENYLFQHSRANGTVNHEQKDDLAALYKILEESGLSKYCLKLENNHYSPAYEPWPTIGEMRKTDKRALIIILTLGEKRSNDEFKYINKYQDLFSSTHWEVDNLYSHINEKICKLFNRSSPARGFIVGNTFEQSIPLESTVGSLLNKLKKIGINTTIKGHLIGAVDFKQLNSKKIILERLNSCENKFRLATILGLDMVEVGDGYETVKEINLERAKKFKDLEKNGKDIKDSTPKTSTKRSPAEIVMFAKIKAAKDREAARQRDKNKK